MAKFDFNKIKNRKVKIISGYIKGVDVVPRNLKLSEPFERLAVAVATGSLDYDNIQDYYSFFDYDLVLKICQAIAEDNRVEVSGKKKIWGIEKTLDLKQLEEEWRKNETSEDLDKIFDSDLFEYFLVKKETEVIVEVRGWHYHRIGGPAPYHDCAVVEIFSSTEKMAGIVERIKAVVIKANAQVEYIP